MTSPDDEELSKRQLVKKERRDAGEASARLASTLMKLPESALAKLDLDATLAEAVRQARAVTAMSARRRAERTVAGALRRVDVDELAAKVENIRSTGSADPRRQHLAERWRARLLDEPEAMAAFQAAYPWEDEHTLPRLVEQARRERDIGKPPGAGRALFRHIVAAFDAAESAAPGDDAEE